MRYYEIFLSLKPAGTKQDKDSKQYTNKHCEAILPVVYHSKTWWHVLLNEEQWKRWKHAAKLTSVQAQKEKLRTLQLIAKDAKRVPVLARDEKWSKLPHVFGPGRSCALEHALDEDVYAKQDVGEVKIDRAAR